MVGRWEGSLSNRRYHRFGLEKGVRYDGEAGHPCYSRGKDHMRGYKNEEDNVLWKHAKNVHGGRKDVKFVMKVLKHYGSDNTTRKSNEAVRINMNPGIKLNSKAEFRQPRVPRVVIHENMNE